MGTVPNISGAQKLGVARSEQPYQIWSLAKPIAGSQSAEAQ